MLNMFYSLKPYVGNIHIDPETVPSVVLVVNG